MNRGYKKKSICHKKPSKAKSLTSVKRKSARVRKSGSSYSLTMCIMNDPNTTNHPHPPSGGGGDSGSIGPSRPTSSQRPFSSSLVPPLFECLLLLVCCRCWCGCCRFCGFACAMTQAVYFSRWKFSRDATRGQSSTSAELAALLLSFLFSSSLPKWFYGAQSVESINCPVI